MFSIRVGIAVLVIVWALDLMRQSLASEALKAGVSAVGSYPFWILAATAVMMGVRLIVTVLPSARRTTDTLREHLPDTSAHRWRLTTFVLLWLGYVALMPVVGFLVSTSLTTACSVLLLQGLRRWWLVLPCALLFALTIEIVFRTVFYVLLPGSFVDEWVDSVLYRL